MPDLLIELFSEEIPARMQPRARDDFRRLMTDGLVEAGLTYTAAAAFSTPRRLVLAVEGLSTASRTRREERKGPRKDAPPAALQGFLRSTGLTQDQLELRADKKAESWFAVIEHPGRPAAEIVAEVLEGVIRSFPWPKSMRWGSGGLRWIRPLHGILCILHDESGATTVPLTVDGIVAGNMTRGHRFMAPDPFAVVSFEDYAAKLRTARVMLDHEERANAIWNDATQMAFAQGMEVVADPALLVEVAGLVEWPVPLVGAIGTEFLDLPPEVLQTSMREHQKFFSLRNPATGRIEKFLTVANNETADEGATVLAGNGKVLAARLADARFFWDNDLRVATAGMDEWAEGLKSVTFHNRLGSQADRVERIAALARELAPLVGADADAAETAARLAKLDLRSEMVGEFPELQGVMGWYYTLAAGQSDAVADAVRDHWRPKGEKDVVPTAPVSVAVAVADKLDVLTGFWAIDEKPTGSKDPFALRRAALGVIRLLLDNRVRLALSDCLIATLNNAHPMSERTPEWWRLRLDQVTEEDPINEEILILSESHRHSKAVAKQIEELLEDHIEGQNDFRIFVHAEAIVRVYNSMLAHDLLAFFHERLKVFLRDEGIRHDVIDAVLAMPDDDDLVLVVRRARALAAMLATPDGENLLQGFRRANNILTQAEDKDGVEYSYGPEVKLAENDAERALFTALDQAETAIAPAMQAEDFTTAMSAMAALRAPIDAFFEATQINTDNQILRRNRLNLLHRIRETCAQVADLTRITG